MTVHNFTDEAFKRAGGSCGGQPEQLPPLNFVEMSNWDNEELPDYEWAVRHLIPCIKQRYSPAMVG